jgi:hypothetical protein
MDIKWWIWPFFIALPCNFFVTLLLYAFYEYFIFYNSPVLNQHLILLSAQILNKLQFEAQILSFSFKLPLTFCILQEFELPPEKVDLFLTCFQPSKWNLQTHWSSGWQLV